MPSVTCVAAEIKYDAAKINCQSALIGDLWRYVRTTWLLASREALAPSTSYSSSSSGRLSGLLRTSPRTRRKVGLSDAVGGRASGCSIWFAKWEACTPTSHLGFHSHLVGGFKKCRTQPTSTQSTRLSNLSKTASTTTTAHVLLGETSRPVSDVRAPVGTDSAQTAPDSTHRVARHSCGLTDKYGQGHRTRAAHR